MMKRCIVSVAITRWIDDHQPGVVEFELTDAAGDVHRFVEKVPIISAGPLDSASDYPAPGELDCVVISVDDATVTIDTATPWHVESVAGLSRFVVPRGAITASDDVAFPQRQRPED